MKKKTLIIGLIISLLLISISTAIMLKNKEELLAYFSEYKSKRESKINETITTINFTTDKVCYINYHTEKISCEVCFEYYINNESYHDCIGLQNDTTESQDNERVKNYTNAIIKTLIPIEEIGYKERDMKGKVIKAKKEK